MTVATACPGVYEGASCRTHTYWLSFIVPVAANACTSHAQLAVDDTQNCAKPPPPAMLTGTLPNSPVTWNGTDVCIDPTGTFSRGAIAKGSGTWSAATRSGESRLMTAS